MAAKLAHRGPDARGVFVDADAGVALGHTRLSIIDLSPAGAQPMASACGRYVITYNGEIYSAAELRPELEALGRRFRGHSDTEIIVEAIAAWGVRATVERLIGMFAFAVFDRKERRLSLVRDRLGIKPLYWGRQNGRMVFASELKAFEALPEWRPEINLDALASYLRFAYVPSPHSIYRGIDKLAPGNRRHRRGRRQGRCLDLLEPHGRGEEGRAAPRPGAAEATDALELLLGDAVQRDGRGCAVRRVSVRRRRFVGDRRTDAGAEHAAGEDLLHRLRAIQATTRPSTPRRWRDISAPSTPSCMSAGRGEGNHSAAADAV